ncbi:MAG: histidine kinase [Deltaproteobacteria bacterium]|nr:MAG: histidine kinase [Deltaproteobacteria bacterium]
MTRRGYAICQITGWTAWSLTILMYVRLSGTGITARGVLWAAIEGVLGFAISHAYRAVVRTRRWAALPLRRLAPRVFVASVLQAVALDATMCAVLWLTLGPDDPPLRLDIAVIYLVNFAIVYLAWSFLYFGLHWLERSRRAEQAELRYLKSQLNPHFLFNALNSIRGLVAEDPPKAQEAITRLAKLLRVALGSVTADTVPLARELEVVDDYLAVEAVRFDDRLAVRLDIAPDALAVPVPAMLVQTLVENGIKHGIARRTDGGEIAVTARRQGNALRLEVSNTAASEAGEPGVGVGLANAHERLQLLFGDRATLSLDRSNPERTTAVVRIPLG